MGLEYQRDTDLITLSLALQPRVKRSGEMIAKLSFCFQCAEIPNGILTGDYPLHGSVIRVIGCTPVWSFKVQCQHSVQSFLIPRW